MKSYLVFFILFLSGNFIGLKAQSSLLMETSLPRDRDTLIMQQVTFCAPGDSGTNVTWDFRDLEYLDVEKRVFYKGRLDSILCMYRNKTAYKYRLSGDSLLFLGYENPVTKMCFVFCVTCACASFSFLLRRYDSFSLYRKRRIFPCLFSQIIRLFRDGCRCVGYIVSAGRRYASKCNSVT